MKRTIEAKVIVRAANGRFILALLSLLALLLRLWAISDRPMHTDEAVHAVILGEMLQTGQYHYNPVDSHGPLLYYLTYPVLRLLGDHSLADLQAWHLRLIPAGIGALTILSLLVWRKLVPVPTLIVAGLLLAISAPVVYYQRYFIHESLFVLLTLLFLNLICRQARSGHRPHWFLSGLGSICALLLTTKETAPLIFLAALLAFIIIYRNTAITSVRTLSFSQITAFFVPFSVIIVLFYSSFGNNWQGLADLVHAQFRFAHRAGGEGHEKPFWTYLQWLLVPSHFTWPFSSGFILISATISLFIKAPRAIRFTAVYSLISLLLYSAIPYKTPWLELNILVPATLPAAYAFHTLRQRFPWLFAGLLCLALVLMTQETRLLCFKYPADDRNPLAYSPTVPDIDNLTAALAPYPNSTTVYVISTDYWPLPWYLRRFQSVGYWNTVPDKVNASVVIVSPDLLPQVLAKMPGKPTVQFFGLRPEVLTLLITYEPPHP